MSIRNKFILIIALVILSLGSLTWLGKRSLDSAAQGSASLMNEHFNPILAEKIPELEGYFDSISLILNADRDAYQSLVASMQSMNTVDPDKFEAYRLDEKENAQQVIDRLQQSSSSYDKVALQQFEKVKDLYADWEEVNQSVTAISKKIFTDLRNMDRYGMESEQSFVAMRNKIDQLQKIIDEQMLATDDLQQREKQMEALSWLFQADRDAYQALVAQIQSTHSTDAKLVATLDEDNKANIAQVKQRLQQAADLIDMEYISRVERCQDAFDTWSKLSRQTTKLARSIVDDKAHIQQLMVQAEESFSVMRENLDVITGMLEENIAEVVDDVNTSKDKAMIESERTIADARWAGVLFMIISLCTGIAIGALVIFIGSGILKVLSYTTRTLKESSNQLKSASQQVSNASQDLAAKSSEQASALQETLASLESLSDMTRNNRDNSLAANQNTTSSKKALSDGEQAMTRMLETIERIKSSSDETAKIIKTIEDIAFQTNLLALNAAVEAARAGEAGAGFAVVADEVRGLAHRSAEAAKSSNSMIDESQRNAEDGVSASNIVAKFLNELSEDITKVAGLINDVADASDKQSVGIGHITQAAHSMETLTQGNAANAEETASASEELSAQAAYLNNIVEEMQDFVEGRSSARKTMEQPVLDIYQQQGGSRYSRNPKSTHFESQFANQNDEVEELTFMN